MVSSIVIIVVSIALFLYWFRYVCLLLLNTVPALNYADKVASENNLRFPDIPDKLSDAQQEDLDAIANALLKDYERILYLLSQLEKAEIGGISIEHHILRLDFQLMRARYTLSRRFHSDRPEVALLEMHGVIAKMANGYGEQVMSASANNL